MQFVKNLEVWFNAFFKRLSVWYKMKTKRRLFILATLLALLINVDSIQLFKYFNRNPAIRKAMEAYYVQHAAALENLSAVPVAQVNHLDSLSNAFNMQIGYEFNAFSRPFTQDASFEDYMIKALGIILSGFAASMGAPFWFDLLKSVYRKPEKTI